MHKMKYILPFLLVVCVTQRSAAQEYKLTVDNPKEGELTLRDFPGDLPIEGYDGNEIVITATEGRFQPPDRAKGLKPVFGSGDLDNTGLSLSMEKNGNRVSFHSLRPMNEASFRLKVPQLM